MRRKNEIVEHEDYAELIITNKYDKEIARAIIDLNKVKLISMYKWYLSSNGYVCSRSNGGSIKLLHRLVMNAPDYKLVDHIDRNKLNCKIENLRLCNKSKNAMNKKISKRNKSGTTGVYYNKRDEIWSAEIFVSGKKYHLGSFQNKEEAIKKRYEAEIKYFKEFRPDYLKEGDYK